MSDLLILIGEPVFTGHTCTPQQSLTMPYYEMLRAVHSIVE